MHAHENTAIKSFADVASHVCSLLESPAQPPSDGVAEIRLALAELHVAALRLPAVEPGDSTEEPASDGSQICAERLASLPIDLYWDIFDPLTYEPTAPIANSADDDLRDIYLDLKRGLALYERGAWRDACWSWRFGFTWHWGEHLVGVQRALYLASRNHPE